LKDNVTRHVLDADRHSVPRRFTRRGIDNDDGFRSGVRIVAAPWNSDKDCVGAIQPVGYDHSPMVAPRLAFGARRKMWFPVSCLEDDAIDRVWDRRSAVWLIQLRRRLGARGGEQDR
jgi:hypothetical protein